MNNVINILLLQETGVGDLIDVLLIKKPGSLRDQATRKCEFVLETKSLRRLGEKVPKRNFIFKLL